MLVERDEAVASARAEAERIVEDLRADIRGSRRRLERETITAPALDEMVARADEHLGRLPAPAIARAPEPPPDVPIAWGIGARARSRSRGWEGRIVALERGGKRATLEVGGMRVSAQVDDLLPAVGGDGVAERRAAAQRQSEAASGISRLRLERARTVASSLDIRGARVDEALEVVSRYLEDASLAGLDKATIIHGLGTGALRDAVRSAAKVHPLVRDARAGERGEGGDGATVVSF